MPATRRARDENEAAAKLKTLLEPLLKRNDFVMAERLIDAISETGATDDDPDPAKMWPHRVGAAEDHRPVYAMDSGDSVVRVRDFLAAQREVGAVVGERAILACDSAAAVFRAGLRELGVDGSAIFGTGLPAVFRAAARNRSGTNGQAMPLPPNRAAMRAVAPDVARIKIL